MRHRLLWSLAVSCGICAATWALAAAATAPPTAKPATAPRHARATHSGKAASAKSAPSSKTAQPSAAGAGAKATGPRTLQDIHIEGEIPVPQVLFITARDQRRFVDFQTQRYLKTSQQVGEQTVFPSRIVVTGTRPADEPKEARP